MTLEQTVEAGKKELQNYIQEGLFYFVNVEDQWNAQRVPNPELQQLGTDFLEKSGIKPLSELASGSGGAPRSAGVRSKGAGNLGIPFRVVHDHGIGTLSAFCVGALYVSGDLVTFVADRATDGRIDRFQIRKSDIKEAKKNKLPLGQNQQYYQGFHVRLQNGVNYNFARIDDQGRGLSADDVLMQLIQ